MVEPKLDGWRCTVAIAGDELAVRTRVARGITTRVPAIGALRAIPTDCVLDGEIVIGAGLPADFYPLAGGGVGAATP